MRQYAGYATAEESNARYKYLLSQGTTGLSVAFDLPTQIGLDSDDRSRRRSRKVGVAIDSLDDMERLFAGIPLDEVSTSMTINATAAILLCLSRGRAQAGRAVRQSQRHDSERYFERIYRARHLHLSAGAVAAIGYRHLCFLRARSANWNTISICGYHIREAGSTAAQEVAFTLADGITYVEAALAAGLEVDDFAPRISFFFNAHNNLLEEIAKFRAARRVGAHHARAFRRERSAFVDAAVSHADGRLVIDGATAGSEYCAHDDPGAGRGVGRNAVAAYEFDGRSAALPTEAAARVALRTQQVIAYESGVADTADPLAGSYAIEELTDRGRRVGARVSKKIEAMGGMLRAIETGYVQREIQESAYRYQRAIESQEEIVVGVNRFQIEAEPAVPLLKIDALERAQIERVRALRARRDGQATESALSKLEQSASTSDNLLPRILECVETYATVGEISNRLRRVWGEYRETSTI